VTQARRDDAAERMTDDRGLVDLQGVEQQLDVVGESKRRIAAFGLARDAVSRGIPHGGGRRPFSHS
jgi:hypothetical protein